MSSITLNDNKKIITLDFSLNQDSNITIYPYSIQNENVIILTDKYGNNQKHFTRELNSGVIINSLMIKNPYEIPIFNNKIKYNKDTVVFLNEKFYRKITNLDNNELPNEDNVNWCSCIQFWNNIQKYNKNEYVIDENFYYKSLIDDNINFKPSFIYPDLKRWELIDILPSIPISLIIYDKSGNQEISNIVLNDIPMIQSYHFSIDRQIYLNPFQKLEIKVSHYHINRDSNNNILPICDIYKQVKLELKISATEFYI